VPLEVAAEGLASFSGVKRRMELLAAIDGISVYDDFAHHPTAIATTLEGLRARVGEGRIIVLLEPRSNTMRGGQHRAQLAQSTAAADQVYWYQPAGLDWDLQSVVADSPVAAELFSDTAAMVQRVLAEAGRGDHVVIMSNGGFDGIHQRLLAELNAKTLSKS
jgi:UDP-N-acetylmuramate: L-alanyl-gamma-D-glutamyl-meso-diaminopimelate ligase